MNATFQPGKIMRDTQGNPIQAHGLTVFFDQNSHLWYWLGENKENTVGGKKNTIWHNGVRLYSSKDLHHWDDCGIIVPPVDDLNHPLHPTHCMDRPHVLYCQKTGKYVMWIKIMGDHGNQFMVVLSADDLRGPYEIIRERYQPLDMNSGDFYLHADAHTGKAYIFFERPHFELICATLTDDYLGVTGEHSAHYQNRKPPFTREAPVFFERNGIKYLFTSGTSWYFPNPTTVCRFEDYHGEYVDLGDPCIGDWSKTSFNSQISDVIHVPGTDLYIACADRWFPYWWVKPLGKPIVKKMERLSRNYQPDTTPKNNPELAKRLLTHPEKTKFSRYVFLPIEWEGDKPVIRFRKKWSLDDFLVEKSACDSRN